MTNTLTKAWDNYFVSERHAPGTVVCVCVCVCVCVFI